MQKISQHKVWQAGLVTVACLTIATGMTTCVAAAATNHQAAGQTSKIEKKFEMTRIYDIESVDGKIHEKIVDHQQLHQKPINGYKMWVNDVGETRWAKHDFDHYQGYTASLHHGNIDYFSPQREPATTVYHVFLYPENEGQTAVKRCSGYVDFVNDQGKLVQRHIYNYMFAKDEQPSYEVALKPVGKWQLGENVAKTYTFKYMNDGFEDGKFLVEPLQDKPSEGQPDQPDKGKPKDPDKDKADVPAKKPEEQPGDHTEMPADKPDKQPGKDEETGKPAEKPDSGQDTPADKPDKKPELPSDKPGEDQTDTPTDKPDDSRPETPGDKPVEQPDKGETEKPSDQPDKKPDQGTDSGSDVGGDTGTTPDAKPEKPVEDDKQDPGRGESTGHQSQPAEDGDKEQPSGDGKDEEATSKPDMGQVPATKPDDEAPDSTKPVKPAKPSQPTNPSKDSDSVFKPDDDPGQASENDVDHHDSGENDQNHAASQKDESNTDLDRALLQLGQPVEDSKKVVDAATLPQTGSQSMGLFAGLMAFAGSFLCIFKKKSQK